MKRNSTELKVKYHGNKDKKSKGRKKNPNVADISKQGYRDDSPYRSMPSIDIHTPSGIIDMSSTGIPLWANGRILPPYSGIHRFDTDTVREIPLAQTGKETRKLHPWEYLDEEGDIYTDKTKLPFDPKGREKYGESMNWMKDWISKRNPQMVSLLKNYMSDMDEKHPIDAWTRKYIYTPIFGISGAYNLTDEWGEDDLGKIANEKLKQAIGNINSVKFRDNSKIEGDSYINAAYGSYHPGSHSITYTIPNVETVVHELGHSSKLENNKAVRNYIRNTIEKDPVYKKEPHSYYHSPDEIYSRVWEIRKVLGLKPNETITKDLLKKKLNDYKGGDEGLDLFRYLEPNTVIKLLNGLVYEKPSSSEEIPLAETGGPLPKHQSRGQVNYNIPVSQQDSVRNMAYKTMLYELERGSSSGTGLSDFGNPNLPPGANIDDAVKWYMKNTMSKLEPGAFNTAMEKAEAGDFIYNTGKDPRIYMLDQYLKSIGQPGLPNRSTFNIDMNENPQDWANKKPELDALWKQYYPAISKLSTNDRRILLNNGRDWYYQNIERGPGSINEDLKAYKKTWYGRIWNTNYYEPYIEKNPKFTPKNKKTGGSTNWLQQFQTTGQVSGAPNIARQVQDFKANQNIINKNNPLNTGAVSDTTRTTIGNIKGHAPKEASLSVRKDIVDPALSALSYAKYVPLPGAAAVGAAADVASLGLAAYDVYSDVSSGNTGYGTAANASKIAGKLLKGSSNPLASGVGTALSYFNKGNAAVKAGKQFSEGNYIGAALSAGKVAKRTGGTAGWLDQYQTGREVSIYPNLYDTPNRITFPITGGWDFSTKGIDNRFALTGYEREGFGKRLSPFVDLGIGTASAPESYGYGTYDSQTNASESVSPMGLGLFGKVGVKPSFAVGKSSVNPRTGKEKFNTSFFIEPSVYADVNAGKVLPRDQEAYLDALDRAKNPTTVMTDPNEKLLTQPWYASINPGARLDFSKTGRIGNIDTKGSLGVMYDQRGPGVVGSFMGESFAGSVPWTVLLEAGYQPGKEGRGFFGGPKVQIPIGDESWNKVKRKKQKASSPRLKQGGWLNQYAEGGPGMPTEETKKPEKTLGDKWITSELEEKINDPAYGDRAKYYSDWYKNQTIEKLKQSGITKDLIKKAVKGLKDKPLDDLSKAMGFDEQVTMALETGGLKNVYPDIYKNMESQGSLNKIKETLNQLGVTNTWDLMDSIYPSVMDLRYNMGVKPSDVITEDTLDNFSKTKGKDKSSLDKLLKIYSKPKLVEMMNTVAENKEPGTEIPMAKTGGPLTKAQNGIVYAPQISERDKTSTNIFVDPRVINMPNPAMSSQPFSKDFEQKYWASPMFRKRLANIHAGTEFGDQQGIDLGIRSWVDRMNKVKVLTTDALSAPSKTTLEDWDKDPELVSAYGNYNTSIPNIFLSNPQIKEINTTPEDVFFHEKGHLRNLTDYEAVEFLKRNKSLTNNPDYQMIMDGLLKDYGPLEAAGVLGEGADDPNLFHDVFPEENYSDLNALRNHMFKNKIYDASKEDLTIDVLKKALSNPAIKNSFSVKRLLKNFSPKDIVELNNKIAGIVDPAVLDKAKTGGLIKAQIGLNNMNTAVAATTSVRKPVIVPMGEPPLPEVFEIVDERKVHPVTGKKIDPKRDLKGGRYDTAVIRSIAEQSKKHGLNQDQALDLMGIAFQETLFGKTDPEIGHALHGDPISGTINKAQVFSPLTEEEANSMSERDMAIRKMIMNYVYNTTIVNKHISDRARRLQYYNTPYPKKGSVRPSTEEEYHGGKSKAFYSVPVTEDKPLSMDTNPYGLTVGSLINDLLSNNPVVKEVFKRTYKNKTGGPLLKAQTGIPKKEVKFQGPGGTFYYDSEGKMISQAVYDQLMKQYRESPQYEKDQFQEILKNETFEEKKAREMGYSPGLAFGLMIEGSNKKMRDSYGPTSNEGVNKFAYTEAPLKDYNPYVDRVANLEGWESLKTYIPDIPRSVMAGEWEKHMYGDKRPYWATLTESSRYIPQRGQMVNQAFGFMFKDYEDPLMSNPIVDKLIRVNKGAVAEFPGDQATYMGHPFDIPNPKYDPQYKIDRWDKVRATRDQQIRYGIDPYTGESASYYPPHYGLTPPKEYEYLIKQPGDIQHPLLKKTGGSKLPVHLPEAYKTGGWLKEFQGTRSSSSVSDQTQRTAAASGALTREQLEKRIALDQMMAEKQRRERQGIIYSTPDPGMAQKKSFGLAMGMPSSQAAYLGTTGTAPALWAPVMVGSHMLYQPVSGAVNVGMGINALSDTPEDLQSVIEDPSFENAFNLGLDILFARSGFKQGKKMWNSVDLPKREVALPKNKKGGWLNGFA